MQLCSHLHRAKSSSHAFHPLNSRIDLFPPPSLWLWELQIDAWPLWSCMCLTGWARQRALDTGGTNYPLIMHCWQRLWDGEETERRKVTAPAGSEKLDSVSLLSRVLDSPAVTCRTMHRWAAVMAACVLTSLACAARLTLHLSSCMRSHTVYPLEHTFTRVFLFMCTDVTHSRVYSHFSSLMHKIQLLLGSALSSRKMWEVDDWRSCCDTDIILMERRQLNPRMCRIRTQLSR